MRPHEPSDQSSDFIRQIEQSQKNITWPHTLVNASKADVYLWKGSPHPTVVQRIAAWLFGLTFMAAGVAFISIGKSDPSWEYMVLGYAFVLLGARTFRNGFPRRPPGLDG
jgi:hypothetical protein